MKEQTVFVDGVPTKSQYSEAEKALAKEYPNFTPKMWEMVKNVNIVMKIMIGMFILKGAALLLFIATQM